MTRSIKIGNFTIGGRKNPLFLISGPCVIEDEKLVMATAERIKKETEKLGIPCIFKSSYKKDNRSNATSYQGPGLEKGLRILEKVRDQFELPILSDVHGVGEVAAAAAVLDVVQIPAFLSQQTSLALEVGKYAKAVNVKKGQFLAPEDMKNPISKLTHAGNRNIMLTERGTMFGYHRLVVDMRSFDIMRAFGYPVIFDVTHSVRIYGIPSKQPAGGEPHFIFPLAQAGIAAGADGIFIETHPDPRKARCDATSMLPIGEFSRLIAILQQIHAIVQERKRKE
jgi:2-dehydro-3-deoxyphosphooctonate aldolase (KDO 8-P synthase)